MDALACIIIGYHEVDLQKVVADLEKSKLDSSAFEQMRKSPIRFHGR